MSRTLAIAVMIALAAPTLAIAENPHHPPGKPGPAAKPLGAPRGAPGPALRTMGPAGPHPGPGMAGPHPGPGVQFRYHGHAFNPVHAAPFVYPAGWGYRRWGIGMALPAIFLAEAYWYADWATLGLAPPEPGFRWVRYGPDVLLVNMETGQVVDVAYGVFY